MSAGLFPSLSPFHDPLSSISRSGAYKFPNPFFDIASEYMPRDMRQLMEYCEYIYLTFGTYRSAARKVVNYFLTEIVLDGESEEERDEYRDFLSDDLHLLTELSEIGEDYMVYGNVFISIYFPFDRFLICPKCETAYHIETLDFKFNAKTLEFSTACAKCKHTGVFKREDRKSPDKSRVRLIRWNPKQIRLRVHDVSGHIDYYWEIAADFLRKIKEGKPFYLNQTPWSIIEACKASNDDKAPLFKFSPGSIYHLREKTLSGIPIKGWAIPPLLNNFKLAYYIQILRRYDEAIALDYIVPHRILFPDITLAPGADPLAMMSMSNFVSHMNNMVKRRRVDPTMIQVAPFKVGYEMLGGEAKALAPKESLAQAMDELLNAMGFPAELYKGTLTIQAFPVALRLFEKTWGALVDGFNDLIAWITSRIAKQFMWGTLNGALRSVTLADDIERKALLLQAAAGMDISKQTAYKPFGIDFIDEQERVTEEQSEIQRLQQEAMDEQQAQQMGTAPASGQAGPGGMVGATPGDVYEQGKALAQQLLFQTPDTMRRGELIKIKHSNPTLHAIVVQEMDNIRQELSRQGQTMMMQQMKMGSAKELPSPFALNLLISNQVLDYTRKDLRKIAADIKRNIKGAKEAFHFIFGKMRGWI